MLPKETDIIEQRDLPLFQIISKNSFIVRPDFENRIFTSLTSLPSEYRAFLQYKEKHLINTDIVGSQLVFSIPTIEKSLKEMNGPVLLPKDFFKYRKLAQEGLLYEEIAKKADLLDLLQVNRRKFKDMFFKHGFTASHLTG